MAEYLYKNLAKSICEAVHLGELTSPFTFDDIEEMFHVSRTTARHAIALLQEENLVNVRKKIGISWIGGLRPANPYTCKVGFISPDTAGAFEVEVQRAVEGGLIQRNTVIIPFRNSVLYMHPAQIRQIIERHDLKGIVVFLFSVHLLRSVETLIEVATNMNVPVVVMDEVPIGLQADGVSLDNRMIGFLGGRYLMAHSPKRLLVVQHIRPQPSTIERVRGLNEAVRTGKHSVEIMCGTAGGSSLPIDAIVNGFIESGWIPNAVLSLNTGFAGPIVRVLNENYLKVGKDVHVIAPAVNHESLPEEIDHFMLLDVHKMCEIALDMLFERIAGSKKGFRLEYVPVEIVKKDRA